MSGFLEKLGSPATAGWAERLRACTRAEVERCLGRFDQAGRLDPSVAPLLFSDAARDLLEELAVRAAGLTRARFGRTMVLYAPIYLSSACVNRCSYCGFSADRPVRRHQLELDQAVAEAEVLFAQGVRHLLLVTGEDPARYGLEDLCQVLAALRPRAASLAVEIFACDDEGYARLAAAGADSLVLYQETYDRELYARLHPAGPKRDFARRLEAVEAGGRAGFRSLGIGALLGLAPARLEACRLASHGAHLQRAFPGARLALSFPRLRPVPGGTGLLYPVSDRDLVQLIVGTRLMFPDAELVISTREPAGLRDRLLPLGVTRLSAGSRTTPGGYAGRLDDAAEGQFATCDLRSVAEVAEAVRTAGFDAVFKDFDPGFMGSGPGERAP